MSGKKNFLPEKINSSKENYTIDVLLLSTKVEGASICSRRNRGDADCFRLVMWILGGVEWVWGGVE